MSDLESRLTAALTAGAEGAPGPDGLGSGARRRLRARRRRAAAAGAVVAVVLAVAVPVGVLASDDGATGDPLPAATDPTTTTTAPPTNVWTTVERDGVQVDLPPGFTELDSSACPGQVPGWGPPGDDPCGTTQVSVLGGQLYDPFQGPGLTGGSGYVAVGPQVVQVEGLDHETARRVLASARPAGTDPVDLSSWVTQVLGEDLVVEVPEVPEGPAVEVVAAPGAPSCEQPSTRSPATSGGGVWRVDYCGSRAVRVTAPTQALADVVASTITELEWQVVRVGDTVLDVPAGWVAEPGCTGAGATPLFGPEDAAATPCAEVAGVFLLDSMADSPLDLDRPGGPCVTPPDGGCAVQQSGDDVVYVRGVPSGSIQRVTESIRPAP